MPFSKEEIKASMLLYAVTDRAWLKQGETLCAVCQRVLDGGATFLQLREKNLDEKEVIHEAGALQALCRERHIPFVVNDSVEVALAIGADGVHVGQSDIRGRDIRAMLGKDKILGISASTVQEALAAEQAGADYIGVGAVFPTDTKQDASHLSPEALLKIAEAVAIPVVAIGGINKKNLSSLAGCKVDGAAVISAIFAADEPGQAAAELAALAKETFGHE